MKLILHIGMGKTGTSSIQHALNASSKDLLENQTQYLGMWFNLIDPAFASHLGLRKFFENLAENSDIYAERFLEGLEEKSQTTGAKTFILSNEAIFGSFHNMEPFIVALNEKIDLELVLYVRNPRSWLPSAYTQWNIHHKTNKGPLKSFKENAGSLLTMYQNILKWHDAFSDILTSRRHESNIDVVADFAETCHIALINTGKRVLDRGEPAETLLRAAFNNRYEQEVFPERFDNIVLRNSKNIGSISKLSELCFAHEGLDDLIEEKSETFSKIKERLGPNFDFVEKVSSPKSRPDSIELQARLIDHLVEIVFQQGERLAKLEKQYQSLSNPED